jgi:hypothetical protein
LPLLGNRLLTSVGVGGLLPTWALLVTQNVVQPCGCTPERMPWGNSLTKAVPAGSSGGPRPSLAAYVTGIAAGQSGLLVDELVVEREEIAFNAGSTMVSIVMRAADFARLSDAQPCRFAQAPPGG